MALAARAVVKGIDPLLHGLRVVIDEQVHAGQFRHLVAQLVHRFEFPCRIDVEQRKRRRRGIESLAGQVQHDGAVLADRVEHHRLFGLGDDFPDDVDALGFQSFEMRKGLHQLPFVGPSARQARFLGSRISLQG